MNAQGTIPQWTLGDRMGKALDHAGIGMQEMADYLGVSRNSVSNWVHGRITPSRQTLLLWSMRTGVDLDWIARSQSDTGWLRGHIPQPRGRIGHRLLGSWDRHYPPLRAVSPTAATESARERGLTA